MLGITSSTPPPSPVGGLLLPVQDGPYGAEALGDACTKGQIVAWDLGEIQAELQTVAGEAASPPRGARRMLQALSSPPRALSF